MNNGEVARRGATMTENDLRIHEVDGNAAEPGRRCSAEGGSELLFGGEPRRLEEGQRLPNVPSRAHVFNFYVSVRLSSDSSYFSSRRHGATVRVTACYFGAVTPTSGRLDPSSSSSVRFPFASSIVDRDPRARIGRRLANELRFSGFSSPMNCSSATIRRFWRTDGLPCEGGWDDRVGRRVRDDA